MAKGNGGLDPWNLIWGMAKFLWNVFVYICGGIWRITKGLARTSIPLLEGKRTQYRNHGRYGMVEQIMVGVPLFICNFIINV